MDHIFQTSFNKIFEKNLEFRLEPWTIFSIFHGKNKVLSLGKPWLSTQELQEGRDRGGCWEQVGGSSARWEGWGGGLEERTAPRLEEQKEEEEFASQRILNSEKKRNKGGKTSFG